MTVKELYEWSIKHKVENAEIRTFWCEDEEADIHTHFGFEPLLEENIDIVENGIAIEI